MSIRTHLDERFTPQRFGEEEVLFVLGGQAAGIRAPVREMTGKLYVDDAGIGHGDRYEIRRIKTQNGPMRALVVTTITDEQAIEEYLAFCRKPRPH